MKFVISFFLCGTLYASPIQIAYESNAIEAKMLKDILMNDYHIPEEIILVSKIKECLQMKGSGKIKLCLKNNGDLMLVSVDREFINESLKVFQTP